MNMCIQGFQVIDYLGLQRLHAITEDGRIFVTDEGYQDISGTTVAEIAYDLCPSHWGRGIAHAICTSVTAWAFVQYGFLRVQATVLTSNARSARVLVACGYQYEGLLRSYRMVRGTPGDFVLYSRLATD